VLDEISNSDLEFIEKVGSGGFGSVWKGQWISKQKIVAIKILTDIDEREVRDLCDTCIVLGTILSIHVLSIYNTPFYRASSES